MERAAINCGELHRLAATIRDRDRAVHVAYAARDAPGGPERWSDACAAFHEACAAMSELLAGLREGVRRGDSDALDAAIDHLDCDVWHFRSGYMKQELMLALARARLTEAQRRRIAGLVLTRIDGPARLEFGTVTTLAKRTGGRELRAGLRERLRSADHRIAHRALIVLLRLPRPRLTEEDISVARTVVAAEIVRDVGRRGRVRTVAPWVDRALPSLADVSWAEVLLGQAADGNEAAGWLVTRSAVVRASAADEPLHVRLVEHLVRHAPEHDVEFHPRDDLPLRDSDVLRTMLLGLLDDGDERVRRRADAAWRFLDGS